MTALPRRVIVDDTDPQIQYSDIDQWTLNIGEDSNMNLDTYPNGPPFQNTTHSSTTISSLSLQFQGSSPQVFGTNSAPLVAGQAYECFIDGTSIGSTAGPPVDSIIGNNNLLCDGTSFVEEKEYTLTLNVTHTAGGPLWFDYVTYIPSTSTPLRSATVLVDRLDPAIVYSIEPGNRWDIDKQGAITQANGSSVIFNFTGTSVSWVGFVPILTQKQSTSLNAIYSIDEAKPVKVVLRLLTFTTTSGNRTNQVFFTTPTLSPGPHSLKVIYQGNNTTPPLTLNHLVVANNMSTAPPQVPPVASASPQPPAVSSTTTTGTDKPSASVLIGGIVGGIIGGITVIFLAAFLLRRRNRQLKISRRGFGIHNDIMTHPHLTPFDGMISRSTMAEASKHTLKAHHSQVVDPPEFNPYILLDRPLGIDDHATPQARTLNRQKLPLCIPPVETVHEPDRGARSGISDEVAAPPPSCASG